MQRLRKTPIVALCALLSALVLTSAPVARADDKEYEGPKDGSITEKQFEAYLNVTREWVATSQAASKAMEGSKTGFGALSVIAKTDEKFKASLAKYGVSESEYSWIGDKVWAAWGTAMMVDSLGTQGAADLQNQQKKMADELAAAKKQLGEAEAAQKAGTRILSKEERAQRVQSAKDQAQAARDEAKSYDDQIKQHQQEQKEANDEAAKQLKAAQEADSLAKNPPKDVAQDDRESYINDRKNEAQSARDAAKEANDRMTEAKKNEDEAKKSQAEATAKATGFDKQAANPEQPATDEEKQQLAKDNADAVERLKQQISSSEQAQQMLTESLAMNKKQVEEMKSKVPPKNLEILLKRHEEFEKALGMQTQKK
jgi:hypothetical protein